MLTLIWRTDKKGVLLIGYLSAVSQFMCISFHFYRTGVLFYFYLELVQHLLITCSSIFKRIRNQSPDFDKIKQPNFQLILSEDLE